MNHISELTKSINQNEKSHEKELPQEIKDVVNFCWEEFKMAKKSWRKELTSDDDIKRYLTGLGKSLMLGGIDSMEKLRFGLEYLYIDESSWLPSTGQFVKWCKDGYAQNLRENEMLGTTKRIMDEKRMISATTFEQRQKTAKSEISKLLSMVKHRQVNID